MAMPGRRTLCRIVTGIGVVLYLFALGIAIVGSQGLFGVSPDGLAAVYLIFLGLPWTLVLAPLGFMGMPLLIGQVIVVVAPLVNIWIVHRLCGRRARAAEAEDDLG